VEIAVSTSNSPIFSAFDFSGVMLGEKVLLRTLFKTVLQLLMTAKIRVKSQMQEGVTEWKRKSFSW
jgi:hypothetical protein